MAASLTLLKIRIWTKLILIGLVALYVGLFILFNTSKPVELWLFPRVEPSVSVLLALLAAFVLGSLVTLLTRAVMRTIQQIKAARQRGRADKLEREIADMQTKSTRLKHRD
jgi:uncharacterized integral membrane protein